MAESDGRFAYTINGVKVVFPCKAYPTQLSMMNMIIKGIERRQNSLLESPTGSGKSLALLCSCLAWQSAEYEKKEKLEKEQEAAEASAAIGCCEKACGAEDTSPQIDLQIISKSEYFQQDTCQAAKDDVGLCVPSPVPTLEETDKSASLIGNSGSGSPSDDDFQPTKKRFRTPGNQTVPSKKRRIQTAPETTCEDDSIHGPLESSIVSSGENISLGVDGFLENKEKCSSDVGGKTDTKSGQIKVPKIFFGTRTHKQIAQISRELRKTEYKKVRMTILSSREHSCVHPVVSKGKNKNEECKKLLDGSAGPGTTCRYYQKVNTIKTQMSLKYHGLHDAWDIEDLVTLGGQIRACPYYAARELMKEADIIFCPYNYLIDPKIRMQMEINLKDQVVVLDEAHNVEDSAREAASLTLTAVDLQNTLDDLDRLIQIQVLTENHRALHVMIGSFLRWIHESSSQLKERGFEQSSKVWSGREIVTAMEKQGITSGTFGLYFEHFQYVMASAKDPNRQGIPSLSSLSCSLLEGIFLIGKFMMGENMKYISDYRCAVLKTSVMVRDAQIMPGGWRRSHGGMRKEWTHSLNFWCLNPAVVFSELGSEARCIILTSGTLSPMATFSSELGVKFPIQLEANHVIANSQVWVGTLSSGPSGCAVNASYQSSETFAFQDEVGKVVLNICETVPHGVLCFFPSYNMLDKLSKRWQSTGLWSQLSDRKTVVSEPRGGDKFEFDDIMHQFYHAVRTGEDEECDETDSDTESSVDGGLFLAVCRGKVSEGLDFADNNARAVITIGIPFPNVKDTQVELKRKYNTQYAASRGLLTGSEWYEIQAYRALNQALGRCIRHKQDWGAILLIDERFSKSPKYTNGISKWLRKRINKFDDFSEAMSSLKQFAAARKLDPCPSSIVASQSQLSMSIVETPVKETSLRFDMKPSEQSTPLLKTQCDRIEGFTPNECLNSDLIKRVSVETPAKERSVHTDTNPSLERTPLNKVQLTDSSRVAFTLEQCINNGQLSKNISFANGQGNLYSAAKEGQRFHSDRNSIQHAQLAQIPENCSVPPNTCFSDVTPEGQKVVNADSKSLDHRRQEGTVLNGMTSLLDYSSLKGISFAKMKCSEFKHEEKRESPASNNVTAKSSEGEGLLEEQLCSSPVLFATPTTTPSSSPCKQEESEDLEGEDETCAESKSIDVAGREPNVINSPANKADTVGKNEFARGEPSIKKCGNAKVPLVKQNNVEISMAADVKKHTVLPEKEESVGEGREEKQPRDLLDEVKDDLALEGDNVKMGSESDSKSLKASSKRGQSPSGDVPKESSNVRQSTRRSMRLRRASNIAGSLAKKNAGKSEVKEKDNDDKALVCCTCCGAGLVTGCISSKAFPKITPGTILHGCGEKTVLVIEKDDSEVQNLTPLVDTNKNNSPGPKLNSVFVPETDSCYIPLICGMCYSANKDSQIVGLELVSFRSSSLLKQVWLYPSLVYVGNHKSSHDHKRKTSSDVGGTTI